MSLEKMSLPHQKLQDLKKNLTHVIRGKDEPIDMLLIALLAGGSVLFEDVPGMGKTTLAKALAAGGVRTVAPLSRTGCTMRRGSGIR